MSYIVKIKPHNHLLYVQDDETVLNAALRQDYIFPYSCQSGICGTCMGKILHGNITYPDQQPEDLSDEEIAQGYALFCSAVPTSNLVIEVNDVIAPEQLQKKQFPYTITTIKDLSNNTLQVLLTPQKTTPSTILLANTSMYSIAKGKNAPIQLPMHKALIIISNYTFAIPLIMILVNNCSLISNNKRPSL